MNLIIVNLVVAVIDAAYHEELEEFNSIQEENDVHAYIKESVTRTYYLHANTPIAF